MPSKKKGNSRSSKRKTLPPAVSKKTPKKNQHPRKKHGHSPFFLIWELLTLACVVFLAEAFIVELFFHYPHETLLIIEEWAVSAEIILIAEVTMLIIIARDKIRFVIKNWPTILAVLPMGGGFRFVRVIKLGWHAIEKTRVFRFLRHPIQGTKRWIHRKLRLRGKS